MTDANSIPLFIDTDMGCDDAVAVAWLLGRPDARVVGISSVFGNSTVHNTTANVLTLLAAAGATVPVTVGAAQPVHYPYLPLGGLSHGPDGLWGAQQPQSLAGLADDAPAAIAAAARAYPDLTLLALGPLTNIARAVQRYPAELAGLRLIALAGARAVGNFTPAAESNAFADPHALEAVLASDLQVDLITYDAFALLQLEVAGLAERLSGGKAALADLLARALAGYARAEPGDGSGLIAVPDAAAAVYALRPDLGEALPATVQVIVDGEHTRGQTLIALTPQHQVALALGASGIGAMVEHMAEADFDLAAAMGQTLSRLPQNVRVVLQVDGGAMSDLLLA